MLERSDLHHSSFIIRHSSFQTFVIRQSTFDIPFGLQPNDHNPQAFPSKPMVTFSPSTMTGTLRAPLEYCNMVSR